MISSARTSSLPHEAAVEATCLWLCGDHESCIQTLQRLELDPTLCDCYLKVQHNLAVVEHYNSKRKEPARLQEQLSSLLTEAAHKHAAEPAQPVPTPRGHHLPPAPEPALVPVDEDVANLRLNKALLHYRQQQYAEALQALAPVLQQVEGLDEGTALHALLLQLDIHLNQQDIQQAALALAALERACPDIAAGFVPAASPSTPEDMQQQQQDTPHPHGHPSGGVNSPSASTRAAAAAGAPRSPIPAGFLATLAQPPVTSDLPHALPFVSKWGSGALRSAHGLLEQRGQSIPAPPPLALLLKLYRVRLALLQQNPRAAKRELRSMLALEAGGASGTASSQGASAGPRATVGASDQGPAMAQGSSDGTGSGGGGASDQGTAAALGAGLGSGSGVGGGVSSHTTAFCRAQVEAARGSYRKAAAILTAMLPDQDAAAAAQPSTSNGALAGTQASLSAAPCSTSTGALAVALQPVLLNDLGVVHHCGARHQLSALLFKQALGALRSSEASHASTSTADAGPAPSGEARHAAAKGAVVSRGDADVTGALSHQAWAITYNAGAQYMALGQYRAALPCLQRCVESAEQVSGLAAHRPLLLLRAAQASLGLHQQQEGSKVAAGSQDSAWGFTSTAAASPPSDGGKPGAAASSCASSELKALLAQALLWLQAAHEAMQTLQQRSLQQQQQQAATAAGVAGAGLMPPYGSTDEALALGVPSAEGVQLEEQGQSCIQQSILVHLAYVHLLLGDQDAALAAATQLLGMPHLSPSQAQAAACYAAEVLGARGQRAEAVTLMASAYGAAAAAAPINTRNAASSSDGIRPDVPQQQQQADGIDKDTSSSAAAVGAAGTSAPGAGTTGALRDSLPADAHAALCTNLAAMLIGRPSLPGPSSGAGGAGVTGPADAPAPAASAAPEALTAEALAQDPGCLPASLLATYLDMMSGRCDQALDRIRAMGL